MGDVLDYERGKLCIGRRVKVRTENGKGNGSNGAPGVLKAASPKAAQVRFPNHGHDTFVPWERVYDWIGGNGGPAPKPEKPPKPMPVIRRMPELTALEHKELKAMTPAPTIAPKPAPASVADLRDAVNDADLPDLGELRERLQAAQRDLAAARKMVEDAKAEEAAAVKVFADLRAQAKRALEMIDQAGAVG